MGAKKAKSSRCSARSRSRGGLERRPIDPRLWARNLDVGNEAPATGFGRGAHGGGAGVGVGCAGPRRTTGRANGAREQKNILAAAPAFGGSLDMTMGRVCAGWQGRGRAGSARGFAFIRLKVRLFVRSPRDATRARRRFRVVRASGPERAFHARLYGLSHDADRYVGASFGRFLPPRAGFYPLRRHRREA